MDLLPLIARLRCCVGLLGEQENADWWPSAFFSASSEAFSAPLFPRTSLLARCHGVTQAAARVHDERIGVGMVFHLFRLPEDLERGLHELLQSDEKAALADCCQTAGAADEFLKSNPTAEAAVGPIVIAGLDSIRSPESWQQVAGTYSKSFADKTEVFPYFRND